MPRKKSKKVIEILSTSMNAEIGAIGVYMDQHYKMADAGLSKFAERLEEDAKEEMKHAEKLAKRILEIGGEVKYDKHLVPDAGMTDVAKIIKTNIDLEIEAVERLNKGIKTCFDEGDNASRRLLEEILTDEEKHLSEYETILKNIEVYGDPYVVAHLV